MSDQDQSLASALGVILDEDKAKSDMELKRTLAASLTIDQKANNDADFARETLYDMITKSNEAVVELLGLAKASQSARHFEVLAQMINGNAIMAEKLIKIHVDHQIQQNNAINLERNRNGVVPGSNVQIQNAVFVGTTKDLLAMVKSTQEKQIIEVEAKNNEE